MKINVVFEGGGIKGIAYIGVLKFLEERGIQIFQIGGTSVGAIIASLIAVGYNSGELERLISNFDFSMLKYFGKAGRVRGILDSVKGIGIYSLQDFEDYMQSLMEAKNKTTFLDVKFGQTYLLKMIAAEWITKKKVIIPDDLGQFGVNPDVFSIAKAAAMSASIPIFYRYYRINKYRFLDGGLVSNFPVDLFSESNIPTLGFRVNDKLIDRAKAVKMYRKKVFKIEKELDYSNYEIIDIDTFKIKATDYRRGLADKNRLIFSGYESIRKYFYQNIIK
ncbi:MAG: patatin-like phospholipase family protein [Bacilli bacterium]|nr:patatin-like phospholipase family protein [Bacilli bacterium]MDD4076892.1 patatin-like phospholipase family protein [Bacilli bacterium]MDD4387870.1 patatin-like phospholipase family protein [Bacilli bacterium]